MLEFLKRTVQLSDPSGPLLPPAYLHCVVSNKIVTVELSDECNVLEKLIINKTMGQQYNTCMA
jgi:hypothetical protein